MLHDLHICRECAVVSQSAKAHRNHLRGRRHSRNIHGENVSMHCPLCDVNVSGLKMWKQHTTSSRHVQKALDAGVGDVQPDEATNIPGHVFCTVCKIFVFERFWKAHPQGKLHKRKLRYAVFEAAFEEASKDKHGISVSHQTGGVDFGMVEVSAAQNGVTLDLTVTNSVPLSDVVLNRIEAKCLWTQISPSVDLFLDFLLVDLSGFR